MAERVFAELDDLGGLFLLKYKFQTSISLIHITEHL